MRRFVPLLYLVLLLAALVAPQFAYPIFLMKGLCFALFACAFNLLVGYTGLLSFGHAAFLGMAGYATGHVVKVLGMPPELGLACGVAAAAALGWVIGLIAIRRQGIYFSMITLALSQMLYFFCLQAKFTGGEDGLQGVPRGRLLGVLDLKDDMTMYYVVLAVFVAGFGSVYRIIHSPFGQVLAAIRENEPRAISLGYQVDRYKLLAFVLSAALSGLAGATKTLVLGFETLTDVHWHMSGSVILMTLLGGMGTVLGPVVGAFTVIGLENKLDDVGAWLASLTGIEWFHGLGESVTIVTGFIFVVCVLAFRRGMLGELIALFERRERAAKDAAAKVDASAVAAGQAPSR
jgi:branched-chain amino acid transport system permease protein